MAHLAIDGGQKRLRRVHFSDGNLRQVQLLLILETDCRIAEVEEKEEKVEKSNRKGKGVAAARESNRESRFATTATEPLRYTHVLHASQATVAILYY